MHIQVETRRGGRVIERKTIVVVAPTRHHNGVRQLCRRGDILPAFILDLARSRQGSWCRRWRRPSST